VRARESFFIIIEDEARTINREQGIKVVMP
jgi:hypothetical protein